MKNNKKLLAVLSLCITTQLMAESSLNVSRNVISGDQLKTSLSKLPYQKIARLALAGKLGTCTATYNGPGTSYMFSYNYLNTDNNFTIAGRNLGSPVATEQAGMNTLFRAASVTTSIPVSQRLTSTISTVANRTNIIASLSPLSSNLENMALQELGTKIKEKIDKGQCGAASFENRTVNFKEFTADTVKFYKDENGGLLCTTTGLENDVADGCMTKKVTSFLPAKVCRLVYQVARGKGNVERGTYSKAPTITKGPFILPLTPEIKQDLAIDKAMKNPSIAHLFNIEKSLTKPLASNYLPVEVLEVIKNKNLELNKFAELPDDVKQKLSNAVLTIEATKIRPEVLQFPEELKTLSTKLKSNVELYMMTNRTSKTFETYEIPKEETVLAAVADQLKPITTDIKRPAITSFQTCRALPPTWMNASVINETVEEPAEALISAVSQAATDDAIATAFVNHEMTEINRAPAAVVDPNIIGASLAAKYTTNPNILAARNNLLIQRNLNLNPALNTTINAGTLQLPNSLPAINP